MQENRNDSMSNIWPQCNEIGNKWQKKPQEPQKYMEIKQHSSQQPVSYRWNETISRNEWKFKHNLPEFMGCKERKQLLEGNL